jgi:peptidyl-tRNA hydrolase
MSLFSESLKTLGNAVADLSELEVITLTGTLGATYVATSPAELETLRAAAKSTADTYATTKAAGDKTAADAAAAALSKALAQSTSSIKWSSLVRDSLTNPEGKVVLAASTLIKIDGDTYNFVSSDKAVTATVLAAHADAVKAGKESRAALFSFFDNLITDAVKS